MSGAAPGSLVGSIPMLHPGGANARHRPPPPPPPLDFVTHAPSTLHVESPAASCPVSSSPTETGNPFAVISAVDVLRLLVPDYILEDMSLAGVFDELGAEDVWSARMSSG